MKEFDIFLSYSAQNRSLAERIHTDLCEYGLRVWIDQMEILVGHSILDSIYEGIRKSRFFAILLTKDSVNSNYVKLELNRAKIQSIEENGSHIILPILAENVIVPEPLVGYKYANLIDDYTYGLNEVLNAVIEKTPERRLILQIRESFRTTESLKEPIKINELIQTLFCGFNENKIDVFKNIGWMAYDYANSDTVRVSNLVYTPTNSFIKKNWKYSNQSNDRFDNLLQNMLVSKAASDIYRVAYHSIINNRNLYTNESIDLFINTVQKDLVDNYMATISISLRKIKHSDFLVNEIRNVVLSINSLSYSSEEREYLLEHKLCPNNSVNSGG